MTSLKTSIKTITYLSDIGCLEIQGASLIARESHKRNIVIMTHNHCLSFLARDRLGKKFKPAYLDALIMHYDGTRLILDGKYNKEA